MKCSRIMRGLADRVDNTGRRAGQQNQIARGDCLAERLC
jgi:hypothetical protein